MGAPIGNQNASNRAKGAAVVRALEAALRKVELRERKEVGWAIERILVKLVEQAMEGDREARRDFLDRYYGKVKDHVQLSGDEENPFTMIGKFTLVKPSSGS
jgi:hypothetical protein